MLIVIVKIMCKAEGKSKKAKKAKEEVILIIRIS
jgi:hypothetical protein